MFLESGDTNADPQSINMNSPEVTSLGFHSEITARMFQYLLDSFVRDYSVNNYVVEKSGWRTLSEISRACRISVSTMYGRRRSEFSKTLEEPVRRRLVETRFFPGERGRGGQVMRIRIVYDKDPARNYVNSKIKSGLNALTSNSLAMSDAVEEIAAVKFLDRRRIAILPLANISSDPADEYLADGLTEELINVISQIQGLRVIAKTSVNQYKNTNKFVSQVGRELGVGTVIEGSVRKAGNRVRTTLQMIDSLSQLHEWSESYDQSLEDIFKVQSDIATKVAAKLKVIIREEDERQIQNASTENLDAYLAYLKGRTFLHSRNEGNLKAARKQFELAISLDKKLARAYSGLADTLVALGFYQYGPYKDCLNTAALSVQKALEIDPALAEAHASLGLQHYVSGHYSRAEREFKTAIKLNSSYPFGYYWYGLMLLYGLHKFEESYQMLCLAEEADPLNARICATIVSCLEAMGRTEEARRKLERLGQIEPNGYLYLASLFDFYLRDKKDPDKAREQLSKLRLLLGDKKIVEYELYFYGGTGENGRLGELVEEVESISEEDSPTRQAALAFAYSVLAKRDKCFEHLELALEGFPILNSHPEIGKWTVAWRYDSDLRRIVNDPRWKELETRGKLE